MSEDLEQKMYLFSVTVSLYPSTIKNKTPDLFYICWGWFTAIVPHCRAAVTVLCRNLVSIKVWAAVGGVGQQKESSRWYFQYFQSAWVTSLCVVLGLGEHQCRVPDWWTNSTLFWFLPAPAFVILTHLCEALTSSNYSLLIKSKAAKYMYFMWWHNSSLYKNSVHWLLLTFTCNKHSIYNSAAGR